MSHNKEVIFNEEVRNSRVFSKACQNSFKVLAIVCELAANDGFVSLDAMYENCPRMIESYCNTARATLCALEKLENWKKRKH